MSPALFLPLLLSAANPLPQEPATDPSCATVRVALPVGLEGWGARAPIEAGSSVRNAPVLTIGRASDLQLVTTDRITPVALPGRTPPAGSGGGLALFQVAEPGTYQVALGSTGWIDVVRAGKSLPAVTFAHGPACTGIRKVVDYRLRPGRYILQLSGTPGMAVPVLIARKRQAAA